MNEGKKARVRSRAQNRCEYCLVNQLDSPLAPLQIEHVIPISHGGTDEDDNLALACIDCNLHKGPNLTGIDPVTNKITVLFHPRRNAWDDHFEFEGIWLHGKTAIGRTSVQVLAMNSEDQLALRSA